MKHLSKAMLVSVLVLSFVLRSGAASAAGNTQAQKLKKVSLQPDGSVFVYGRKVWRNPDGCEANAYAVLAQEHTFYRENYALLLLAHAQEKGVVLRVDGCVSAAGRERPVMVGATIQ